MNERTSAWYPSSVLCEESVSAHRRARSPLAGLRDMSFVLAVVKWCIGPCTIGGTGERRSHAVKSDTPGELPPSHSAVLLEILLYHGCNARHRLLSHFRCSCVTAANSGEREREGGGGGMRRVWSISSINRSSKCCYFMGTSMFPYLFVHTHTHARACVHTQREKCYQREEINVTTKIVRQTAALRDEVIQVSELHWGEHN